MLQMGKERPRDVEGLAPGSQRRKQKRKSQNPILSDASAFQH